eukprot:7938255-Heterocapsa_arctica.AAC.1
MEPSQPRPSGRRYQEGRGSCCTPSRESQSRRELDWHCPICGAHKFGWRDECTLAENKGDPKCPGRRPPMASLLT